MAQLNEMNYDYYEVEEILDCRVYRSKKLYLVKWKGYSSGENTWEPLCNLKNVNQLIVDFHKQKKRIPQKQERSPLKESKAEKTYSDSSESSEEDENCESDDGVEGDQDEQKQVSIQEQQRGELECPLNQKLVETNEQQIKNQQNMNYPVLFEQLVNTQSDEQINNQKMKLLRNQVPIDYLQSFYQQINGANLENYQFENGDSQQYPTESFLQKPIVKALLRQLIQFTDADIQEIAIDQMQRARNRFFGLMK